MSSEWKTNMRRPAFTDLSNVNLAYFGRQINTIHDAVMSTGCELNYST